jgi:hypothetical protein
MHFCQKGGLSFLEVSKSSLLPAGLEKKNRANACSAISFMYSATLQSAGRATIWCHCIRRNKAYVVRPRST